MWQTYAILSALCAAMTAIFANLGTDDTNPNLATAIRTTVILFLTWAVAFAVCDVSQIRNRLAKHIRIPGRTHVFGGYKGQEEHIVGNARAHAGIRLVPPVHAVAVLKLMRRA